MKRYLTIQDNRMIGERFAQEIVNGEIEATPEFKDVKVGMVLFDGVWQKDPQELAEQQKQQRISELGILIEKKKLRGYDYSVELQELEALDPIL